MENHQILLRKIEAIKNVNDEIIERIDNKNGYNRVIKHNFSICFKEGVFELEIDTVKEEVVCTNVYYGPHSVDNFKKNLDLIHIEDIFNDGLNFDDCECYKEYKQLNERMLPVVKKWVFFGNTNEAVETLRKWKKNYEDIHCVLGEVEKLTLDVEKEIEKENEIKNIISSINNSLERVREISGNELKWIVRLG